MSITFPACGLPGRFLLQVLSCASVTLLAGCYVPLRSPGIPARELPPHFRVPQRTFAPTLNLASLTVPGPADYILGPNDTVEVTVPGLFEGAEVLPIQARIMADDTITLPLVGKVKIGAMNLSDAQTAINQAYADGFLVNPRVSVALGEKQATDVSIIGQVTKPGVYALPRYENDVGHALAHAGGMLDIAAERVEVHRRISRDAFERQYLPLAPQDHQMLHDHVLGQTQARTDGAEAESVVNASSSLLQVLGHSIKADTSARTSSHPMGEPLVDDAIRQRFDSLRNGSSPAGYTDSPIQLTAQLEVADPAMENFLPRPDEPGSVEVVLRIPLRGGQASLCWEGGELFLPELKAEDVLLESGDVVLIPRQLDEVFFVTGPLSQASNRVNFSVQNRDRQLGNAFLIPPNRDIDVVTAVAMAGYIDPIDSPSTVTVHRSVPGGAPMLIHVDLIAARFDWNENLYVQPGDIIYLNPDCAWWSRRTFDRVIPILLTAPYTEVMRRWIAPFPL